MWDMNSQRLGLRVAAFFFALFSPRPAAQACEGDDWHFPCAVWSELDCADRRGCAITLDVAPFHAMKSGSRETSVTRQ
jgi:hypothetical protein